MGIVAIITLSVLLTCVGFTMVGVNGLKKLDREDIKF